MANLVLGGEKGKEKEKEQQKDKEEEEEQDEVNDKNKGKSAYVQKADVLEMIDTIRAECYAKLVRRPTIYSGL